ncbi:hypothetical protein QZM72_07740 [Burkholderia sp. AU45388]|nr:hypothetical protein [Burkholderia sp. AU45388]
MPTTRTHGTPPAANGATNEPVVIDGITPVKVVKKMSARWPAKFWIPPRDATCACVGVPPTRAR